MVVPGSMPNMILSSANTPFLRYFANMPKLPHKATQFLRVLIKLLIVGVASFVIWNYLQNSKAFQDTSLWHQITFIFTYSNIGILLLLTTFNWVMEIFKWQSLVSKIQTISFKAAAIQSLTAHVSALSTPAKMGDFGTKAMYFMPKQRKKVLFLSFLGNWYQMLATAIFGIIGIGVVTFTLLPSFSWHYVLGLITAVFFWFLFPKLLNEIRWSFKGFSWQRIQEFTATLSSSTKQKALGFAFLKYLIFAHQFYFLLRLYNIELGYGLSMGLISSMYLLSSLVPVMQLLDVVVRGGVAVLVFGLATTNESAILIITLVMWLLNVALPIIPGSYFVLTYSPLAIEKVKTA